MILAFSDNPNNSVSDEQSVAAPAEPVPETQQETPITETAPAPEKPAISSGMSDEQKNLINDLILCFDGREENL